MKFRNLKFSRIHFGEAVKGQFRGNYIIWMAQRCQNLRVRGRMKIHLARILHVNTRGLDLHVSRAFLIKGHYIRWLEPAKKLPPWMKMRVCQTKWWVPLDCKCSNGKTRILNTLWLFNIAMENCSFLGGLPINSMVIFHGYVSHNQMVKNDGKHWINGCPILRQIHRKKNGLLQGKHIRKPPYILHIS
jgi:hypothetical protein